LISRAFTDSKGGFELSVPEGFQFCNIIPHPPEGYAPSGADSTDGVVVNLSRIQHTLPLRDKDLKGNKFWMKPLAVAVIAPLPSLRPSAGLEFKCPDGCQCLTFSEAEKIFEYPERCQAEPCGTAENGDLKYCF
jgi:hypothetical protein